MGWAADRCIRNGIAIAVDGGAASDECKISHRGQRREGDQGKTIVLEKAIVQCGQRRPISIRHCYSRDPCKAIFEAQDPSALKYRFRRTQTKPPYLGVSCSSNRDTNKARDSFQIVPFPGPCLGSKQARRRSPPLTEAIWVGVAVRPHCWLLDATVQRKAPNATLIISTEAHQRAGWMIRLSVFTAGEIHVGIHHLRMDVRSGLGIGGRCRDQRLRVGSRIGGVGI